MGNDLGRQKPRDADTHRLRNRTDGGQEGGSRQYSVPEAKGIERKG